MKALLGLVVVLLLLLLPSAAAQARACRDGAQRGDGYWQYRIVDGRRCWYRGRHRLDKSALHWRERTPPHRIPTARAEVGGGSQQEERPTLPPPVVAEAAAAEVTWPAAPLMFAERFGDMPAAHALPQQFYDDLPPKFGGKREPLDVYAFDAPAVATDEDNRSVIGLASMLMLIIAWLALAPPILLSIVLVMLRERAGTPFVPDPHAPWRTTRWKQLHD